MMNALNSIILKLCGGVNCNECPFNKIDGMPGCLLAERIENLASEEPELVNNLTEVDRKNDDTIYRQAVYEVLSQLYDNDCFAESERDIGWNNAITNVKLEIEKLPSVEPKYCPNCGTEISAD